MILRLAAVAKAPDTNVSKGISSILSLLNRVFRGAVDVVGLTLGETARGLLLPILLLIPIAPGSGSAATVSLSPGDNLQSAINSNPPGTIFSLNAGVYRMQSLTPLAGDKFIGQSGANLNGSMLVTNWVRNGAYWVSAADPELNTPYGSPTVECQSSSSGCAYPQDLFLNSKPLTHQLALPIGPGQWYFDYIHDRVYMADNPTGQTVELSVTRIAFGGSANNVTVQHLLIQKYAVPLFSGAIMPQGSGWIAQSNTIRLNHGAGIKLKGNNEQILTNLVVNNGESGIGIGGTSGNLIKSNTISGNNYAKCNYANDAGGIKLGKATNTQILNNTIANNDANGIWVDANSIQTTITGNTVTGNTQNGIRHEYSSYSTISNNTLQNNGQAFAGTCNSNVREIVAADSNNVSISGNNITSNCGGITLTQGTDRKVVNVPMNLIVTDNIITYSGLTTIPNRIGGQDSETTPQLFTRRNNNYFDYNIYHFSSTNLLTKLNWQWGGSGSSNYSKNWASWRSAGQDTHGTAK